METKVNRWLILVACIIINLCLGAGYAWSVFQAPLMEQFGWTTAQASLAFSISFAMVPISMMIFGPMQDKEGPRKITFAGGIMFGLGMVLTGFTKSLTTLYITYGLILGFGIGMAYGCTTATTVKWFPDKKGLAGGLTAAGFGSGAIILAPIAVKLIGTVGVLHTFKFLGVALGVIIAGSSLLLSVPKTVSDKSKEKVLVEDTVNFKPKEIIKTVDFWILWAIYTMGCVGGMMIIGHASPIANEHIGFTIGRAATVVSIVALANTLGRIVWGTVSDKIGRYNTTVIMFVSSGIGLLLLNMTKVVGSTLSVVGIAAIALSFGGFLGIFPGITAETWGPKNAGSNYGFVFTAYGIAAIFGPRLAAVIKESNNGNYGMAFLIAIGMNIIGIVLTLWFKSKKKKDELELN